MGRWALHPIPKPGCFPYRLSGAREQHGLERLTPFVSAPKGLSLLALGNQLVISMSAAAPPLQTSTRRAIILPNKIIRSSIMLLFPCSWTSLSSEGLKTCIN